LCRSIIESRHIKRPNFRLLAFAFLLAIKTALRLVAQQSTLDHLRDELRHDENLALGIVGKIFMQVLHHMRKNIETNEVKSAKCRRPGTANSGTRNLIHLFDRIAVCQHRANRLERTERADAISEEV